MYGTIPAAVKQLLQEEYEAEVNRFKRESKQISADELAKRHFARYDSLLDQCRYGNTHLRQASIAQTVIDTLFYWDNKRIELIAFCVMANHVHVVLTVLDGEDNTLDSLLQSMKSFSAREATKKLGLSGKFWEEESYDRLVRDDDELIRIVRYVLQNPVKAGLCSQWRDWPWSYVKEEYDMF
ncbi:REP-associated tyrosine transposase [Fibrella aquatica]|uniref:REP-associated tyrosine transposase n=1 Tax=Fibrella aquatica TaxID=3242487 RepID=UPI0035224990